MIERSQEKIRRERTLQAKAIESVGTKSLRRSKLSMFEEQQGDSVAGTG